MKTHFENLPILLIGKGVFRKSLSDMEKFSNKRILIIAEESDTKHHLLRRIKSSVSAKSVHVQHHLVRNVRRKLTCSHRFPTTLLAEQYEVIVGVGGNDLLNYAKIVSIFSKRIDEYPASEDTILTKPIRQVALFPTTVTNGFEVSNKTYTYTNQFKKVTTNESILPATIVYDPLLCIESPLNRRVNSSVTTLSKAFEGYFLADKDNKFTLATLKLLFTYIVRATYNRRDIEAQEGLLKAGMLLGLANVLPSKTELMNCFTIPLIRRTNCSYAGAAAVMLPYLVKLYRNLNEQRGAQLVHALISPKRKMENDYGYITFRLMNIFRALGFPTNLKVLGIDQEELSQLAFETYTLWCENNDEAPRWNELQFLSIYTNAYAGIINDSL